MTQNVIAKNLSKLKDPKNYQEIEAGYFSNRPEISGYLLEFEGFKANAYLIVNTSDKPYKNPFYSEENYNFIIYNSPSLEEFINKLPEEASSIIKVLQDIQNKGTHTGKQVPYGYEEDEEGKIKLNPQEAMEVKKIFKDYVKYQSIRKVAGAIGKDYTFVHDILHDVRYAKMPIKIVPDTDLKKVMAIIQQNTKNKYRKSRLRSIV